MIYTKQEQAIKTYLSWVDKQLAKDKAVRSMPLRKVGEFRDHEASGFTTAFMLKVDELRTFKKYANLHYDKLPKNYATEIIRARKRNFRQRLLNELLMIY